MENNNKEHQLRFRNNIFNNSDIKSINKYSKIKDKIIRQQLHDKQQKERADKEQLHISHYQTNVSNILAKFYLCLIILFVLIISSLLMYNFNISLSDLLRFFIKKVTSEWRQGRQLDASSSSNNNNNNKGMVVRNIISSLPKGISFQKDLKRFYGNLVFSTPTNQITIHEHKHYLKNLHALRGSRSSFSKLFYVNLHPWDENDINMFIYHNKSNGDETTAGTIKQTRGEKSNDIGGDGDYNNNANNMIRDVCGDDFHYHYDYILKMSAPKGEGRESRSLISLANEYKNDLWLWCLFRVSSTMRGRESNSLPTSRLHLRQLQLLQSRRPNIHGFVDHSTMSLAMSLGKKLYGKRYDNVSYAILHDNLHDDGDDNSDEARHHKRANSKKRILKSSFILFNSNKSFKNETLKMQTSMLQWLKDHNPIIEKQRERELQQQRIERWSDVQKRYRHRFEEYLYDLIHKGSIKQKENIKDNAYYNTWDKEWILFESFCINKNKTAIYNEYKDERKRKQIVNDQLSTHQERRRKNSDDERHHNFVLVAQYEGDEEWCYVYDKDSTSEKRNTRRRKERSKS